MRPLAILALLCVALACGCSQRAEPPGFYGIPYGDARRIVLMVDRSGSMDDMLDYVKPELRRAVADLAEDQEFCVIFFSADLAIEPDGGMAKATAASKAKALALIDAAKPGGEGDVARALRCAFAMQPDAIYILSDGFGDDIVPLARQLNADCKVRLDTICPGVYDADKFMREISRDSGGTYRWIDDDELLRRSKP